MIKINNISKSFNNKIVLKNVSLSFQDGKITAVLGPNGCGKSTLSKIICGIYKPDEGEIFIDDELIYSNTMKYKRDIGKQIQIVFQEPYNSLDPKQKVGNSLIELIKHVKKENDKEIILKDVLNILDLKDDILSLYPYQISGGEAQRINLAKCLILDAKYIILDEATSMLDVITQSNIFYYINKLVKEKNIGIILISHDYELVKLVSDTIYRYDDYNFILENKDE